MALIKRLRLGTLQEPLELPLELWRCIAQLLLEDKGGPGRQHDRTVIAFLLTCTAFNRLVAEHVGKVLYEKERRCIRFYDSAFFNMQHWTIVKNARLSQSGTEVFECWRCKLEKPYEEVSIQTIIDPSVEDTYDAEDERPLCHACEQVLLDALKERRQRRRELRARMNALEEQREQLGEEMQEIREQYIDL